MYEVWLFKLSLASAHVDDLHEDLQSKQQALKAIESERYQ